MRGKADIARRIYDLSEQIKGMQDESKELREKLTAKMKPGQVINFDTPEGPFRIKLCESQETVLEDNQRLFDMVGHKVFVQAAKVGVTALREALFADFPVQGNDVFAACTKAVVKKSVLKLLRGRE